MDCYYSADEYKYHNSNICELEDIKCKYCCIDGGCSEWVDCNTVSIIIVLVLAIVTLIFVAIFICFCKIKLKTGIDDT